MTATYTVVRKYTTTEVYTVRAVSDEDAIERARMMLRPPRDRRSDGDEWTAKIVEPPPKEAT